MDPLSGFYFFFRVDSFFGPGLESGSDFCRRLLEDSAVALMPGAAFGDDRWVRLSYSVSRAALLEALARISRFAHAITMEASSS